MRDGSAKTEVVPFRALDDAGALDWLRSGIAASLTVIERPGAGIRLERHRPFSSSAVEPRTAAERMGTGGTTPAAAGAPDDSPAIGSLLAAGARP